jgi:cytochrome c oxidase assembly protein subunit 15
VKITSVLFSRLAFLALVLTFFIVILGAFVRLSDAGLGCPDWPGCYGHLGVPMKDHHIEAANAAWPERPVEVRKAWKEMIHRYFASSLGLILIGLAVIAWRLKRNNPAQQTLLPYLLVPLVMLQGAFGMWTVTLKVHPVFVTAHLIFGMLTLALIWQMWLNQRYPVTLTISQRPKNWKRSTVHSMMTLALIVLPLQIALGGWVSTNYAAIQCGTEFPGCQGQLIPDTDFGKAFDVMLPIGPDYEGGHLDNTGRVTVHFVHRLGAVLTLMVFSLLCFHGWKHHHEPIRQATTGVFVLLLIQIGLGISNVIFSLPIAIAVAHNGGAALLLLALMKLHHHIHETGE